MTNQKPPVDLGPIALDPVGLPMPVVIHWHKPEPDSWNWFTLLTLLPNGWCRIQGRTAPDGTKHRGEVMLVHCSEVFSMVEAIR